MAAFFSLWLASPKAVVVLKTLQLHGEADRTRYLPAALKDVQ